MTFQIELLPYGMRTNDLRAHPDKMCVFLFLLDGGPWQRGRIEFELSAGQNKFSKRAHVAEWTDKEVGSEGGFGMVNLLPVEELKKAKTVTLVLKHSSGKPGDNLQEFKLKTASQ